jgi:hypothetical protein
MRDEIDELRSAAPRSARLARVEPWPVAVGLLLLAMIGACLAFWAIAATHPDPVVGDPWQGGAAVQAEAAAP